MRCSSGAPSRYGALRVAPGLGEGRVAALLALAVDVDVDDLVVERDEALQGRGHRDRALVAPRDVLVAADVPVRRGALVRARGALRGGLDRLLDVALRQRPARR